MNRISRTPGAAPFRRTGGTAALDAVVVGAGPNGLAAAIAIARAGHRVLVLERGETPGGGARTAELTLPGFRHDVCSAVHPLAFASPFFRSLRLEEHGLVWIHPPLPLAHPFDDRTAAILDRTVEATAAAFDPPDTRAWMRLFGPITSRWEAISADVLGPVLHRPRHLFGFARFGLHALRSGADLARGEFRGAHARALFAGLAAHGALPLEQRPGAAFGLVLGAAAQAGGWPFPRGGAQAITDALVRVLESAGGRIETGRVVARWTDLPDARVVLLDLTPRQILEIAGAEVAGPESGRLPKGGAVPETGAVPDGSTAPIQIEPSYRRRLAAYRYGPGVFKLDLALEAPVPWRAEPCRRAGTVHLGGTLEEIAAAEREVAAGRHAERPFVLVAQPSLFDPARAPEGRHTLWAYCHVPNGSADDRSASVLDQIERFAPGFRGRVLAMRRWTTADLEAHDPNLVGGDIGGGANDLRQVIGRPVLRWDPYEIPVRGAGPRVFLCSSATPPGGGVHGMCGAGAARSALRALRRG